MVRLISYRTPALSTPIVLFNWAELFFAFCNLEMICAHIWYSPTKEHGVTAPPPPPRLYTISGTAYVAKLLLDERMILKWKTRKYVVRCSLDSFLAPDRDIRWAFGSTTMDFLFHKREAIFLQGMQLLTTPDGHCSIHFDMNGEKY
jgi:hypothetical protein